jgi:hypothetical protein
MQAEEFLRAGLESQTPTTNANLGKQKKSHSSVSGKAQQPRDKSPLEQTDQQWLPSPLPNLVLRRCFSRDERAHPTIENLKRTRLKESPKYRGS